MVNIEVTTVVVEVVIVDVTAGNVVVDMVVAVP